MIFAGFCAGFGGFRCIWVVWVFWWVSLNFGVDLLYLGGVGDLPGCGCLCVGWYNIGFSGCVPGGVCLDILVPVVGVWIGDLVSCTLDLRRFGFWGLVGVRWIFGLGWGADFVALVVAGDLSGWDWFVCGCII